MLHRRSLLAGLVGVAGSIAGCMDNGADDPAADGGGPYATNE